LFSSYAEAKSGRDLLAGLDKTDAVSLVLELREVPRAAVLALLLVRRNVNGVIATPLVCEPAATVGGTLGGQHAATRRFELVSQLLETIREP
jgi:hypothetical protein